ncbi:MAG TPA: hypothetical protein ENK01_00795 [Hellea balneolensis]|uniref:Uncharacterized protein n=1 Tax=Hellea balneolensis TaxID=287478 RepID=A0A7V5NWA4_9PROT|nr:hypothetical protein [Hellea balneolensis]
MQKVEHIFRLMKSRQALIMIQSRSGPAHGRRYILTPYGDRRRRPIGWLTQSDVETLLAANRIEGGPDTYYLALGTAC